MALVEDQTFRRSPNDVVELFTKWEVLKEALSALVRKLERFGCEAVILGHIFITFPCIMQPFLWVNPLSETLLQKVGSLVIVTLCTTNPKYATVSANEEAQGNKSYKTYLDLFS